jgi:hypothetical protein
MSFQNHTTEKACYQSDPTRVAQGITFHLPLRRRFIPYTWLLHAELNQSETEFHLHYTHSVVTMTGTSLGALHDALEQFHLHTVRELPPSHWGERVMSLSRIEIVEKISD